VCINIVNSSLSSIFNLFDIIVYINSNIIPCLQCLSITLSIKNVTFCIFVHFVLFTAHAVTALHLGVHFAHLHAFIYDAFVRDILFNVNHFDHYSTVFLFILIFLLSCSMSSIDPVLIQSIILFSLKPIPVFTYPPTFLFVHDTTVCRYRLFLFRYRCCSTPLLRCSQTILRCCTYCVTARTFIVTIVLTTHHFVIFWYRIHCYFRYGIHYLYILFVTFCFYVVTFYRYILLPVARGTFTGLTYLPMPDVPVMIPIPDLLHSLWWYLLTVILMMSWWPWPWLSLLWYSSIRPLHTIFPVSIAVVITLFDSDDPVRYLRLRWFWYYRPR